MVRLLLRRRGRDEFLRNPRQVVSSTAVCAARDDSGENIWNSQVSHLIWSYSELGWRDTICHGRENSTE
jgi:hypothetical protein